MRRSRAILSLRRSLLLSVCAFAFSAVSCNVEQQAHDRTDRQPAGEPKSLSTWDREFIDAAAHGNNAEVAIGGTVKGRALSPAVLAYGRTMVMDHSAANARLAAIARQYNIALPTSLGEHQAGFDRVVDRRGQPYDREFMQVMIGDHQQAVRLYKSELASGTDPLLRMYAAETLPKIQAHLAHAQSLAAIAEPPQEKTAPPTPDAIKIPPRSTAAQQPDGTDTQ